MKENESNNVKETKINIIDSIMGSGKTTWAINYINNNQDKKFIYITPYLDEIKRLREATHKDNRMYEPVRNSRTKKENFHKLLSEGSNVCSTHALFRMSDDTTRQALKANNYILILDEVMDVVEELQYTQDDINQLLQTKCITIGKDYFVKWNPDKMDLDFQYNELRTMALNNTLVYINNKLLYWNFPVDIFNYFKEVYILTYMFDCQIQRYYYDFHNIKYKYFQVDDSYSLIDYSKELYINRVKKLSPLINIYEGNLNSIGDLGYSLSANWYKKDTMDNKILQTILKNNIYNWFVNHNRLDKSNERLWTCFKDYKNNLKGKGYTKRFISLNVRATNEYKDTKTLAYCCNRYIKPNLVTFFDTKNIKINQERYALSEMLQWIWRSRIRQNQSINIYIPSKRMRELLEKYLKCDDKWLRSFLK